MNPSNDASSSSPINPLSTSYPTASVSTHSQPQASSSSKPVDKNSLNEQKQQQQQSMMNLPYEERLPKIWKHLASSIANCMHKAEKAGNESTQENCRELNDSVLTFIRTRMEFHRTLGNVEAKLRGKAQEREALEGYVRTEPRLGKRKRQEEEIRTTQALQMEVSKLAEDGVE